MNTGYLILSILVFTMIPITGIPTSDSEILSQKIANAVLAEIM
jgi:hypothetical protein